MLVKRRFIMTGLMLLVPCLIKVDQRDWLYEHLHLSIDDQKNLFDQRFQNELEESLFKHQRMSAMCKKVRNVSLLYTAVPLTVGLLISMLRAGDYLTGSDSVEAGIILAFFASTLVFTLPVGILSSLAKWLTDEQIEQYEQKLKEHRWKMAYLGQCFTGEQIEQYEQKLKDLGLKVEASDNSCAINNLLFDHFDHLSPKE